ncbi:MAG: DUF1284 domain-containing protein [Candidatus Bathyarchaeia archaeon]
MLNLRAHHLLCLVIPSEDEFKRVAPVMFRRRGYTNDYIGAYMGAFDTARSSPDVEIRVLDGPKEDDTCIHCGNYGGDVCLSPQASVFAEWDRELLALFGLRAGGVIRVRDLYRLVREKINPKDMPGVCRGCLFDILDKCRENLYRLR